MAFALDDRTGQATRDAGPACIGELDSFLEVVRPRTTSASPAERPDAGRPAFASIVDDAPVQQAPLKMFDLTRSRRRGVAWPIVVVRFSALSQPGLQIRRSVGVAINPSGGRSAGTPWRGSSPARGSHDPKLLLRVIHQNWPADQCSPMVSLSARAELHATGHDRLDFDLAATRPDLITGIDSATAKVAPYGSVGVGINCAVIGFINKAPDGHLAKPVANSQFPPR